MPDTKKPISMMTVIMKTQWNTQNGKLHVISQRYNYIRNY